MGGFELIVFGAAAFILNTYAITGMITYRLLPKKAKFTWCVAIVCLPVAGALIWWFVKRKTTQTHNDKYLD